MAMVVATAAALQHKRLAGLSTSFCLLQLNGQVYCQGDNYYGQLGLGTTSCSVLWPTQMLGVSHAVDICMGDYHVCLVDDGQVKCVGQNIYNQLGDGNRTDRTVLVDVLDADASSQVFCGPKTTCALTGTDGGAWCWGANFFGELGEVWCSGYNLHGQLGNGEADLGGTPQPVRVVGLPNAVSISCGDFHTCAVSSAGEVFCWGGNGYGQLGLGLSVEQVVAPQQVVLGQNTVGAKSVWISEDSTFVLMRDGTAMAFGYNKYGVLGNGNTTHMHTPVVFASGQGKIQELRGGEQTTCVLLEDNQVRCLGGNDNGQFGNGERASGPVFHLNARPLSSSIALPARVS
ncbi:hypothetical protein BASA81_000094 [Batrachochytrium salamandrivorans]|nr:hypothetical protein BASA81_000094 [Batrachochytrium salamandrivorans]